MWRWLGLSGTWGNGAKSIAKIPSDPEKGLVGEVLACLCLCPNSCFAFPGLNPAGIPWVREAQKCGGQSSCVRERAPGLLRVNRKMINPVTFVQTKGAQGLSHAGAWEKSEPGRGLSRCEAWRQNF